MSWIVAAGAFVYDFLADDGWELLLGLAVILPLTFALSGQTALGGGLFMIAGVLLTMAVSLARKLPKPRES